MQITMRRLFLACMLCLGTVAVQADTMAAPAAGSVITISTGLEGGGYWSAGERLRAAAASAGLQIDNQSSTGSLKNLERLTSKQSPVALVFAQADALQYFIDDNPYRTGSIEQLQTLGEECVFIISEEDSDIESDQDMQDSKRMQLGIKSPQSGIWVTFNYMSQLVPELRDVTLLYGNTVDKINELLHPDSNIDRAVMVVHGTNAHSPEIDMVVAQPDKFRFVELTDKRLVGAVAGREPVYHFREVRSEVANEMDEVDTICVRGLFLANTDKLTGEQRASLAEVVAQHWDTIHP